MSDAAPATAPEPAGGREPADIRRDVQRQYARVLGLRARLYSNPDPSADDALAAQLAEAEQVLEDLQARAADAETPADAGGLEATAVPGERGRFLGARAKTSVFHVDTTVNMHPVPTGVYNLLDPDEHPLLTVTIANTDRNPRCALVTVHLEGLSARQVQTVELDRQERKELKFLPALLPRPARAVREVQRATLHVKVEELSAGGERPGSGTSGPTPPRRLDSHETYSVVCLARTSSFNSVKRPDGTALDLSQYYGAWITPYHREVQRLVRRAADLIPGGQVWGYQGDPDNVPAQVEALYRSLKEANLAYVNSVIDYGAPAGQATQRTRLPRESLGLRSANCIDGAVLFASLLEGSSLNACLVLVPGHAFVGWEKWDGADEWDYLETTMIGTHDFADACASARKQVDRLTKFGRPGLTVHKLLDLRARGIYPME